MTLDAIFLALTIPARSGWHASRFVEEALTALPWCFPRKERHFTLHLHKGDLEVVQEMEALLEGVEPPLQRIERKLHPWVSFGVIPLFGLAN